MAKAHIHRVSRLVGASLVVILLTCLVGCGSPDNSSIAKQFSLIRKPLANDARGDNLIPQQIATFDLRPSQGLIPGSAVSRHFIGIYETFNGKQILLSAVYNEDNAARQGAVTGINSCAESNSWASAYPDGAVPYSLAFCKGNYQFNWINGNWIISAATYTGTSSADLISFVNSYPY